MKFKEFLEKEESKLFDLGFDQIDQVDEVLGSALKFLGGVGGNLASQTARGIGNAVSGVAQTGLGAGQGVLSALQAAGGGRKKSGETFSKSLNNLTKGGGSIIRGAGQLAGVLSGVSPILRGAQAASEPLGLSGVYAPDSNNRTFTQDLLGLDSWEKPEPKPEPRSVRSGPNKNQKTNNDKTTKFLSDLETKEKSKSALRQQPEAWKRLVISYKSARTSEEREEIKRKMRLVSPHLYKKAVEAGLRKKKIN